MAGCLAQKMRTLTLILQHIGRCFDPYLRQSYSGSFPKAWTPWLSRVVRSCREVIVASAGFVPIPARPLTIILRVAGLRSARQAPRSSFEPVSEIAPAGTDLINVRQPDESACALNAKAIRLSRAPLPSMTGKPTPDFLRVRRKSRRPQHAGDIPIRLDVERTTRVRDHGWS